MQETGPFTCSFPQANVGHGNPISDPAGSNQPNRQTAHVAAYDVERVVRGTIVDQDHLDTVKRLRKNTLKC
jgi:hypothetical protein